MKRSKIVKLFDHLEDKIRHALSRTPIVYALIAGVAIVLFWRGTWLLADEIGLSPLESFIASVLILLLTGTFVSFFIGEQILISGLRQEKKIDEKTEEEIVAERKKLEELVRQISEIRRDVAEIKERVLGAKKDKN